MAGSVFLSRDTLDAADALDFGQRTDAAVSGLEDQWAAAQPKPEPAQPVEWKLPPIKAFLPDWGLPSPQAADRGAAGVSSPPVAPAAADNSPTWQLPSLKELMPDWGPPAQPTLSQGDPMADAGLSGGVGSSPGGSSQYADYIRQRAPAFGIDPETAVRVHLSESPSGGQGDQGSSFGPFQLHYGNVAPGGNAVGGLGDEFTRQTGLDARDPSTWKQQIDFTLAHAAQNGWGAWHGAARVGIGDRQGIGQNAGAQTAGNYNNAGDTRPSQFGDTSLSPDEALAACGPAAAVAFARVNGRQPTLREATDLAKSVGWTPGSGMAGPQSQVELLNKMGVPSSMTAGADAATIDAQLAQGSPVIVSTPNHYFTISGRTTDGRYVVGTSGTDLRGGSSVMSLDEIGQRGGGVQATITMNGHPTAQSAPSAAPQTQPQSGVPRGDNVPLLNFSFPGRQAQQAETPQPDPADFGNSPDQVRAGVAAPYDELTQSSRVAAPDPLVLAPPGGPNTDTAAIQGVGLPPVPSAAGPMVDASSLTTPPTEPRYPFFGGLTMTQSGAESIGRNIQQQGAAAIQAGQDALSAPDLSPVDRAGRLLGAVGQGAVSAIPNAQEAIQQGLEDMRGAAAEGNRQFYDPNLSIADRLKAPLWWGAAGAIGAQNIPYNIAAKTGNELDPSAGINLPGLGHVGQGDVAANIELVMATPSIVKGLIQLGINGVKVGEKIGRSVAEAALNAISNPNEVGTLGRADTAGGAVVQSGPVQSALEHLRSLGARAAPGADELARPQVAGSGFVGDAGQAARGRYDDVLKWMQQKEAEIRAKVESYVPKDRTSDPWGDSARFHEYDQKKLADYQKWIEQYSSKNQEVRDFPGGQQPRVVVPDDIRPIGTSGSDWNSGPLQASQPGGAAIRGTSITLDDPRMPDVVYHATTNKPAIESDGMIRAGGKGGLGGDNRDQIVSMTVNRAIAEQIASDIKLAAEAARKSPEEAMAFFKSKASANGWEFDPSFMSLNPDTHQTIKDYFYLRKSATGQLDPLFMGDLDHLKAIDPNNVGVIAIPKKNLDTGALLTDFDLGKRYLEEVRLYGDVPLGKPRATLAAGSGFIPGSGGGPVWDVMRMAGGDARNAISGTPGGSGFIADAARGVMPDMRNGTQGAFLAGYGPTFQTDENGDPLPPGDPRRGVDVGGVHIPAEALGFGAGVLGGRLARRGAGEAAGSGFVPGETGIVPTGGQQSSVKATGPIPPPVGSLYTQAIEKPPAPNLATRVEGLRRDFVRSWTDRQVDLAEFQKAAQRTLGRPLNPDEMAYELLRLNPDKAAEVAIQQKLRPAIQAVGHDQPLLSELLTYRDNVDVAAAMNNPNRKFSFGLTAAESEARIGQMRDALGPERFATLEQAAGQVQDFVNSYRQRMLDSGVWSQSLYDELATKYPNYVPTRILDYMKDPARVPVGKSLDLRDRGLRANTVEGTLRGREDPLASLVRYAYDSEAIVRKNDAFNAFVKLAQGISTESTDKSLTPLIREVKSTFTPTNQQAVITGFVDGVRKTYVAPKILESVIKDESTSVIPGVAGAVWGGLMNLFRAGATSRNPVFLASNAFLDAASFAIRETTREGGGVTALPKVLGELGSAYADTFKGLIDGTYHGDTARFLSGGGGQFGFFNRNEKGAADALRDIGRKNVFQIRDAADLKKMAFDLATLKPVDMIGERIELAPRVAAMRLAEKRGANSVQAVINGRNVTIDFAQGGNVAKVINQFVPFFNVGVQGAATLARTFHDNPKGFALTATTLLAGPTLAAEAWNRMDPQRAKDYADVPQSMKDAGVVIMLPGEAPVDAQGNRHPQFVHIRTREFSPLIVATREAASRALGDSTRDWGDLIAGSLANVSPVQGNNPADVISSFTPLGASTALQLATNRDYFRNRDIATKYADEQASALSKGIAGVTGARPSQVEFAARDLGSGVAGTVMAASDLATGNNRKNDNQPQNIPAVGGLYGRFVRGTIGGELEKARAEMVAPSSRKILAESGLPFYNPSEVPGEIEKIPLTRVEQAQYQDAFNKAFNAAISKLPGLPGWKALDQTGREDILRQLSGEARQTAELQVARFIGLKELRSRASKLVPQ